MSTWQDAVTPTAVLAPRFPACARCDLSHFGLIRVSGGDMRTFLQGQLTNDLNAVTPSIAQLSSYCSPKGRMLGSFWIFERDGALYLQLPRAVMPGIVKRLQMFVLRADVRLDDASESLARFGLVGECAAALLPFAPDTATAVQTHDGITIIRLPGDPARFEIVGQPEALAALWTSLADRSEQVGADFWSLMDIRAGIPSVHEETIEAFVPQMANLQLVGGVSFHKGCYTGQEVVARMQYLGKLKRRMYRAQVASERRPMPGDELYSAGSESAQGAGRIVDAAPTEDGDFEVLAVVQISSAEAGDLRLYDAGGPTLSLLDLPYDVAAKDD